MKYLFLNRYVCFVCLISLVCGSQNSLGKSEIIKVTSEEEVIINTGSRDAIKVGEVFQIYGSKSSIHPATGKLITRENVLVAIIEVKTIEIFTAKCRIVKKSRHLLVGDKVWRVANKHTNALTEEMDALGDFDKVSKDAYSHTIYSNSQNKSPVMLGFKTMLFPSIGYSTIGLKRDNFLIAFDIINIFSIAFFSYFNDSSSELSGDYFAANVVAISTLSLNHLLSTLHVLHLNSLDSIPRPRQKDVIAKIINAKPLKNLVYSYEITLNKGSAKGIKKGDVFRIREKVSEKQNGTSTQSNNLYRYSGCVESDQFGSFDLNK
jgi:hypothetical protein